MAFDVEAARAEGYTDEEIQQYLATRDQPLPPDQPRDRSSEQLGVGTAVAGDMLPALAGAVGTGLAAYGTYQGAKYAIPKIAEAVQNLRGNPTMPTPGSSAAPIGTPPSAGAQRIPISTGPVAPTAPAPAPTPAPTPTTASGRPMSAEAQQYLQQRAAQSAPTAAAEAQPASQISRAQSIVRSLALDKLLKGGVGMAAALTPGNAGQNYGAQFPQSGPYRGMEINPRTGRPWTPQELQQYR